MRLSNETKRELVFVIRWTLVSSIVGLILFSGANYVSGGIMLNQTETTILGLVSVLTGGMIEWYLAECKEKK